MSRLNIWSCGGGTQSAAIAALIVRGRIPKPDIALMVDTEREQSSTWDYAHGTLIPALASVGVELHIIKKSDYATVDLYAMNGDLLLPVYSNQSGKIGKLPTFCSNEWKQRVARRYLKDQGVTRCRTWIGISRDEMHRVRVSNAAWCQNFYPLIEAEFALYYSRADCVKEVLGIGWPEPPRSACWMCSNMGVDEWLDMRANRPRDFVKAVAMDYAIRVKDPHVFLHEQCVPLDKVNWELALLETRSNKRDGCTSGMCFV